VSAVIMILVVTVGMSMLFAFFVNYARDFQRGSGSAVLESVVIENIWVQDADTVEIWVYNVGKVDSVVKAVYVNDVKVAFIEFVPPDDYPDEYIDGHVKVGTHVSLLFDPYPSELYFGRVNMFKIVTERGSSVEGGQEW